MVDGAEEDITADSCEKDCCSLDVRPYDWISGEVLGLKGVNGREPDKGSPCEIESEVVMANIDGPEIPILVYEKVYHIYGMEDGRDQD